MKNPDSTIGVLLLNLGGPDSLDAVKPFLYNLFSDRMIIRLGPAPLQKPLAWLISTMRTPKVKRFYELIGGKSPILELTKAQAAALEAALKKDGDFRVFIGMRYWHPRIRDEVARMEKSGIKKFIALSLYPQYSIASTGSSLEKLKEVARGRPLAYDTITDWHTHPLYIEALADTVKKGLARFDDKDAHVLFSAHGLPVKFIEMGDPYQQHIRETVEAVAAKAGIAKWSISYQSRTGPVKWLGPGTDEAIKELAAHGVKRVLAVAVSFVSDHIETLYEIDILYRKLARGLGIDLKRAEALNTHPLLIGALKDIVLSKKRELGW